MGINLQNCKILNQRIKRNNKVKICLSYDSFLKTIKDYPNINKVRLYVDEFMFSNCFCHSFEQLIDNYRPILLNGYYTSSHNMVNDIILRKLQQFNNGFITTTINHQMRIL